MSGGSSIDFPALAQHINSVAAQGDAEVDPEVRRTGLIYVIELDAVPPANSLQGTAVSIQAALVDDLFDKQLPNLIVRPLHSPLSDADTSTFLNENPSLARFLLMQVSDYSFDELDVWLGDKTRGGGFNSYDLGYQLRDGLNQNARIPRVRRISPDRPSDFHLSCHGRPEGHSGNWAHAAMQVPEAWKLTSGEKQYGEGVLVGHPDTGFSDHPALNTKRLRTYLGKDFADGIDEVRHPMGARDRLRTSIFNSEPGHGTMTASLIMSARDTDPPTPVDGDLGVIGVAPRAELVPIRVCDSTAFVYSSRIARGVGWAIEKNCHVISISIGGFFAPGVHETIAAAIKKNILVVAAAGNCVVNVVSPAHFCIAVGASNHENGYWEHSPRVAKVTIAAPGDDVRTTFIGFTKGHPEYGYNFGSGTSFSTGYVGGLAALWRAFHGSTLGRFKHLQVVFTDALTKSSFVPDKWNTKEHGAGIVDAKALLQFQLRDIPDDFGRDVVALDGGELRSDEMLVGTFVEIFGGMQPEATAAARQWFGVATDEAAREKIGEFGYEMINALFERDKPSDVHANALPEPDLISFIRNRGSNALRNALAGV